MNTYARGLLGGVVLLACQGQATPSHHQFRSGTSGGAVSTTELGSTSELESTSELGSTSEPGSTTELGSTSGLGSTSEPGSSTTGATAGSSCWELEDDEAGSSSGGSTGGEECPVELLSVHIAEGDAELEDFEDLEIAQWEDASNCETRDGLCTNTTEWCCAGAGTGVAVNNTLQRKPKLAPRDLGEIPVDPPRSAYSIINTTTEELTLRLTWQKKGLAEAEKSEELTVKAAPEIGKVSYIDVALEDDFSSDYKKFEVELVKPKNKGLQLGKTAVLPKVKVTYTYESDPQKEEKTAEVPYQAWYVRGGNP
jgi:hypothetical protein